MSQWSAPPSLPKAWQTVHQVNGARLHCVDTGGSGHTVVLLHPVTGTASIFAFQLHALAAAGFRAISYSRRGHGGSDSPSDEPGIATKDLCSLLDLLSVEQCSLIAAGGGGGLAIDFAYQFPDRVTSLVLACSLCGMSEPGSVGGAGRLIPKGFRELPITFKELGPAFRWTNPDGVASWEKASCVERVPHPPAADPITTEMLTALDVPVLKISGDADLYVPPPRLMELAGHFKNCEAHVATGCGHAVHWERPEFFNGLVLDFLQRNVD